MRKIFLAAKIERPCLAPRIGGRQEIGDVGLGAFLEVLKRVARSVVVAVTDYQEACLRRCRESFQYAVAYRRRLAGPANRIVRIVGPLGKPAFQV